MYICKSITTSASKRTIIIRSKKSIEIFHCENCDFDFFDFNPENLLIEDKLDQSRLKAAGLDIPSIEEDKKIRESLLNSLGRNNKQTIRSLINSCHFFGKDAEVIRMIDNLKQKGEVIRTKEGFIQLGHQ